MPEERGMSEKDTDSGWGAVSDVAKAWNTLFDAQIDDWQKATLKMSRWTYGPAEALRDVQRASIRNMQFAALMAQLWRVPWPDWPPASGCEEDERAAIRKQYEGAKSAAADRKAEKVAGYYAKDVIYVPEFAPRIQGREGLEVFLADMFCWENLEFHYEKIEPRRLSAGLDMAWELGEVSVSATSPEVKLKGRYLVVWQKYEGEWLMSLDIMNSGPPEE